ncbi:MAG: hypothetical protein KME25_13325 [Symplocastrum torsivum CPER-KK1]|uniref:Uncharacterized protein n=1 Tax=Symplocastrum torsivum CPER-KK1 TaxID=450513 RepID=A0A951PLF9_9CYAN|nr:hypothetical protein [Microcoleus sp. FACHB-SPT15]MBW4545411.1 hypothetical protein [Symplocastrum torsivum CPER-KK1]
MLNNRDLPIQSLSKQLTVTTTRQLFFDCLRLHDYLARYVDSREFCQ